ncbi:MAG: imidazoleglycerol-phosphate dehydratase HisB [Gemmatimonadales bacterium]
MSREATVERITAETELRLRFDLDGTGEASIETGIGFFDHMLGAFARHGIFNLVVHAEGDLHVDGHHTVEDTGIALGQAIAGALGDRRGICRYGEATIPLDEALVRVVVDCSGRPFLAWDANPPAWQMLGEFDVALAPEFFRAVAVHAGLTLHIDLIRGTNAHHIVEATFKAFARALDAATTIDPRVTDVPSTKGML